MNLEEARKVYWLKSYHKTLGELMDEGYLNQSRLEWAAEKAYNPSLKEAAHFLLQWQKESKSAPTLNKKNVLPSGVELPNGMSLEQAKSTLWPLAPFKGQPMGMLAETKQISIKDLGYAIENAWDERVRKAAMVLTLVRLDQAIKEPEVPAGFLKVISGGKSYSEYKQDQLTLIQGMLSGAILTILVFISIWMFNIQGNNKPSQESADLLATPAGIIALIVLIVLVTGIGWLANLSMEKLMNRIDKQKENYRKGEEGENKVVEIMGQTLDGNWSLFRNVLLPGRKKTDLDAVLIGPSGVWVLEIKAFNGKYRNVGEHWEYYGKNRWMLYKKSPSRQAKDNAVRFSEFLKADGISQWVAPAVIWANPESQLTVENPSTAVWTLDRLPDELGNIWQGNSTSEAQQKQITEKLEKLCKKQSEVNK